MIIHSEMVTALAKSGDTIVAQMTGNDGHILHMALGISGEVAELIEAITAPALDRENLIEELGDLEFYAEGLRQGLELPEVTLLDTGLTEEQLEVVGLVGSGLQLVIAAGNLLDVIKRRAIYRKELDEKSADIWLRKLHITLAIIRAIEKISREEVIAANIAKLGERYKGLTYSDQAAQDRADKVEA